MSAKPVLIGHSERTPKIDFQYRLSLNEGQKYCRMHSAILSTFIELLFSIKTIVLSILSGQLRQALLYKDQKKGIQYASYCKFCASVCEGLFQMHKPCFLLVAYCAPTPSMFSQMSL